VVLSTEAATVHRRLDMQRLVLTMFICSLVAFPLNDHADACTSFVMDTPDGPYFGCNLDLFIPGDGLVFVNRRGVEKEAVREGTTGETLTWVSEYGSVTFSLAGNEFAWGGMNEAGLVMSSMQLSAGEYPKPDERPGLLDGNWGQFILDTCSSIDEVIATDSFIRVQDSNIPSHYLVSDAEGNCVAVEYLNGEFVYYAGDDLPVKAMSNMRYDRALYAYEHGGTRWWWSNPGRSAERFATCRARADAFDPNGETPAVNYALGTLVYYVAAPHTRWNIVFDIASREIHYRSDQSPTYKKVSMSALDFSCEAPKLMLDVNAQIEGDVEAHFALYDPTENLRVFRTFCERYGIKVSEADAISLTEFFDGFECAQ
jgi:choloylglycine hydrolase